METRGSGILLHITSLPSAYGIGDLGPGAYGFADFLSETHQRFWQILPLNVTCQVFGNSPYSSYSAYAGNPLMISPDMMVKDGILSKHDIKRVPAFPAGRVNYRTVTVFKNSIFNEAFKKNRTGLEHDHEFQRFCRENSCWLDDYSLFISLKGRFSADWGHWPADIRDRKKGAVNQWREKLKEEILMAKFLQYIFFRQWFSLKSYCEKKNIHLIGDMAMYVNYDSADVWSNPGIFNLDKRKRPLTVAGVPPDYFSSTGQLWGHPVYRWDRLKKTRFFWWIKRLEHNMKLFDMFRLDHFRGFVGYWEVRAGERSARNGRWVSAPAEDFFNTLLKHFSHLPLIAEDLGDITPYVREIMKRFGFPGMKVLLFAFGERLSDHQYAPHNHIKNCLVYTGTHDNNTVKGWYRKELGPAGRKRLSAYLGREVSGKTVHMDLVRLAMMSVADMVIIPMQDILGLGEKARMNLPASKKGNWQWRLAPGRLSASLIKRLAGLTRLYGRA
ncbi:MAG TPA: 4-alpha-glucanotransferase [Nitrospirae bacterium]|nr:4-alpha-glucanotransferase [bacterium BMS3Abin10]GBE37901.1 4-alpha-glucanotransferase [bacterium BMS3Bbin08]HDH50708.1 4-alpha-glucanotransferase [Nitrospirota bacterium]HDK17520.1 4-alpha-glucanotransferase [Nitrospirota bacterium]HDK81682.1 4-alpha-glucanotransferase [Nitrospirota bacterium]